jgi:hypothetical protein
MIEQAEFCQILSSKNKVLKKLGYSREWPLRRYNKEYGGPVGI